MKLVISLLTFLLAVTSAQAQQLNVIQVKGNRAIVEVQTGEKLKVGESYAVGKVDGELTIDDNAVSTAKAKRDYLVGMDLSVANTKADYAGAQTMLNIEGTIKFGWNKKMFEYGPLATLQYEKEGSLKPNYTYGLGAFGTYNFQPNTVGTELVFSGDAEFTWAQAKEGSADSVSAMEFTVGPFAKWFGTSDNYCFRGGLVFSWSRTSPSTGDITTTGVQAIAGIATYF